jgi:hypothetical protein
MRSTVLVALTCAGIIVRQQHLPNNAKVRAAQAATPRRRWLVAAKRNRPSRTQTEQAAQAKCSEKQLTRSAWHCK